MIYRNDRTRVREQNTNLMKSIKEKITASNVQNQNANIDEKSFGGRVGEASDTVLKQYALDNCMSEMSRNNHLNRNVYRTVIMLCKTFSNDFCITSVCFNAFSAALLQHCGRGKDHTIHISGG